MTIFFQRDHVQINDENGFTIRVSYPEWLSAIQQWEKFVKGI